MSRTITEEDLEKLTEAMNLIEHGAQASLREAGAMLYDVPLSEAELKKIWELHDRVKKHWYVLAARRDGMRAQLKKQQPVGAK